VPKSDRVRIQSRRCRANPLYPAMKMCLLMLVFPLLAAGVSPVQKVLELLASTKTKVQRDMNAEEQAMVDYADFCDDEATKKGNSIKTAERSINELTAAITDNEASIAELTSEIATLGSEMAGKDKEIASATVVRNGERAAFVDTEKEMVATVDELTTAVIELKKSMSFLQAPGKDASNVRFKKVTQALSKIVDAAWVGNGDRKALKGFLQQSQSDGEDADLRLSQPETKTEGQSNGIEETIEDMKTKAEEALTSTRQSETKSAHAFNMMVQGFQAELSMKNQRKADATTVKEATGEEKGRAEGELAETKKTKAADAKYLATLKSECQDAARSYEVRQNDAKAELGAIAKATEILTGGVRVFVQIKAQVPGDDDDSVMESKRALLVKKLKSMAHEYHSFAMMQVVTAATSDPFSKIRGLIQDMIAKLVAEANEEGTQKAFCDEELGKSKKSQQDKSMTLDKYKSRADKAESGRATLTESVKELESEMSEIDTAQAEATKIRNSEKAEYLVSSKDFKDAAEATEQAIVVLKEYYEGASLLQTKQQGDGGHAIIAVLEMAAEDFTKTYTELEGGESKSQKAFDTLMQENRVSRAAKAHEVKAKQSEIKSLAVALANYKTDSGMVGKELDAVMVYIEKLRPQCESKVMSYAEKVARREAEIEGLKEAVDILTGTD